MITFEKIREIFRAEKDSRKMQPLPENLFIEIADYIRKKESTEGKNSSDMRELENIRDTIKRFFEIRERKLIEQVFISLATEMPPENLTKEEEELFREVSSILRKHRFSMDGQMRYTPLQPETPQKEEQKTACYMFLKELPPVVGPDMKVYSFRQGHIIQDGDMPKPLNDLLLKKGFIRKHDSDA